MRKFSVVLIAVLVSLTPALVLAHGKGMHVMGTVTAAGPDHLMVKKDGKEVRVGVTGKTKFLKGTKKGAAADVSVGARVVAHLSEDGNAVEVKMPSGTRAQ